MKNIGAIRADLALIHTYRNMAVQAVDQRDSTMLENKLLEIERRIANIRATLEAGQ